MESWSLLCGHGQSAFGTPGLPRQILAPGPLWFISIFCVLQQTFHRDEQEFWKSIFFYNPAFKRGIKDDRIIDRHFFNKTANLYAVANLKFSDLFFGGILKSFEKLNGEFNLVTYLNLCGMALFTKNKYKSATGNSISLEQFFDSFKKGWKSCRKILSVFSKNNTVATLFNLLRLNIPPTGTIVNFIALWNCNFLPNRLREFIFKF